MKHLNLREFKQCSTCEYFVVDYVYKYMELYYEWIHEYTSQIIIRNAPYSKFLVTIWCWYNVFIWSNSCIYSHPMVATSQNCDVSHEYWLIFLVKGTDKMKRKQERHFITWLVCPWQQHFFSELGKHFIQRTTISSVFCAIHNVQPQTGKTWLPAAFLTFSLSLT